MSIKDLYVLVPDEQEMRIYDLAFQTFEGKARDIPTATMFRTISHIKADSYIMEVWLNAEETII